MDFKTKVNFSTFAVEKAKVLILREAHQKNAIQSCMTLTDIRLTEYMGLKEKGATTELSI